jgi:solute carrier family 10 (sodium/bile acid cotransporter), member 7
MKFDAFLVGIPVAFLAALAAPHLGGADGPLRMGLVTNIGVAVMFFLHGAAVSLDALKSATAQWRLHLLVHSSTYVLFPAIGLAVFLATRPLLPGDLRLGFFYLCCVSSTVSSSVALTSLARGNVSGAMFDATLSALMGMVLTPLLVGAITVQSAARASLLPEVTGILLQLLVPFVAGQLLRPALAGVLRRHRHLVRHVDQLVILLIVYSAFCGAAGSGFWVRRNGFELLELLALTGGLLATVLTLTTLACRALGFSREDEVAGVFCGSKKSLVNGAPIAKVIFGASPALGVIMLPLLFYHPLQLIVCSLLARRYASRAAAADVTFTAAKPSSAGCDH